MNRQLAKLILRDLNKRGASRFTNKERKRIGVLKKLVEKSFFDPNWKDEHDLLCFWNRVY